MPAVDINNLTGLSSALRVISILLYQPEIDGCKRYSNGLTILSPSKFCKQFGSNPSYLRLYLTLLNETGLIRRLSIKRGKIRLYINRPPVFQYADQQTIPEGMDQLDDRQLENHAQFRAEYKPEIEITHADLLAAIKELAHD